MKIKSNSSIVTRDILYLTIDVFLSAIVKKDFSTTICRLVSVQSDEWQYLLRGSNENAFCMTTGNVSLTR